jgi:hypothetical protein
MIAKATGTSHSRANLIRGNGSGKTSLDYVDELEKSAGDSKDVISDSGGYASVSQSQIAVGQCDMR